MDEQGAPAGTGKVALMESEMDVLTAIRGRRSIRRFTGAPVSEAALDTVLDAGFCAPSASNRRPWHYLVIRRPETLEAIAAAHPYAKMMPAAGCCVVVCGDRSIQPAVGLLVEDCSAVIENILLAAHGIGLGAVWCGIYLGEGQRELQFHNLLGLPAEILPVGMIALGHPAETKVGTDRWNASRVHYEAW